MNPEPFTIERTFNASIEKVWKAITDKDQMKVWYFDLAEFRPEVGFEFTFEGGDEENKYLHFCEVTDVIKGKKLTYSWRYEGTAKTYVTFELFETNGKTKLRLTHEGIERISGENPAYAKENFVAGWTQIIGTNLKEFLREH